MTESLEGSLPDDGFGDWRHWAVTTLAKDLPAAFPGGPSHAAGSPIHFGTLTRDRHGRLIGFTMPSPAALALSISIRSARDAEASRLKLQFRPQATPLGNARGVTNEHVTTLYGFFESCMSSVVFALNALEIYANQTIADALSEDGRYVREIGDRTEPMASDKVQRLPLEEKLAVVLPKLLATPTPRTEPFWAQLGRLKHVRNTDLPPISGPLIVRVRPGLDAFAEVS